MVDLAGSMGLRRAAFFPFAIDTDTFRPRAVRREYVPARTMLFFMMSRLDWAKNDPSPGRTSANENDRVFLAFARFLQERPDAALVVADRGADKEEANRLVASLGIADRVRFVAPMSRDERIRHMLMADVCLDQFGLGAYGLGALESMACGKPLITYIREDFLGQCGLPVPPVLNARTVDEILSAMRDATDQRRRDDIGRAAREWVVRFHGREGVCGKLVDLYRQVAA
jgi:glycosyltransferase involved in cell wall biosynthesis